MAEDAFVSALVAEHGKWLFAFLRGLVGDVADAEDAYQDTWVRVIRSNLRETDARAVRAYLVKTARSVAIDRLRRRHVCVSLDDESACGETAADTLADGAPDPCGRYESSATAAEVRAAIAELPLSWRQVVLMRIEGELEFKEIARELELPIGTVLTWMNRATKELKRKFKGE